MLRPSLHVDTFARDRLPPPEQWPRLRFDLPALQYPDRLNCAEALLDRALKEVDSDKPAILWGGGRWSYGDLAATTNRIAHVLVEDLAIVPGARVLLHGANSPQLFACWLAIIKAGAIAVSTMPMLRARELLPVVEKADITLALCQEDLVAEVALLQGRSRLQRVVGFTGGGLGLDELARAAADKPPTFEARATSQDDVCLIAFTSGTTGEPKATLHFHRDVLAMCDTFAAHMLPAARDGVFSGTPPIAFTFGLGAVLVFPLYFRATMAIPAQSTPSAMVEAVQQHRVTHLFTSPTGYRAMLSRFSDFGLSSLRACVSAGEPLSKATSDAWFEATGLRIIDGIGATEMIHIFISAAGEDIRPGSTGKAVPGYTACLLDEKGEVIEGPGTGRLGVDGPTGCRYLADARQKSYVVNGWNVTGDMFRRDEDGYFWHVARTDDMIVSSGYNIAGPEVEAALALHPDVEECAVVGWPDTERGQIVKAVVVPRPNAAPGPELARALQDHVKAVLAPYKYPRAVEFCTALPKTQTGKLQRSALRAPQA